MTPAKVPLILDAPTSSVAVPSVTEPLPSTMATDWLKLASAQTPEPVLTFTTVSGDSWLARLSSSVPASMRVSPV